MSPLRPYRLVVGLGLSALLLTSGCSGVSGYRDVGAPYPTISPRAGMTAVSWSYFAFGVPKEWRQGGGREATYWRDAGGDRRLYAEVFSGCGDPRAPERKPPKLVTYGSNGPLKIKKTKKYSVPGAAGGWRYDLVGSGGERRTALNTWIRGCKKEIWLVISAPKQVADRIADSVVAQAARR